jgi:hypothetical protein
MISISECSYSQKPGFETVTEEFTGSNFKSFLKKIIMYGK